MKKLLIATVVGAIALTGCATNNARDVQPPHGMQGKHPHGEMGEKGEKHGERHGKKDGQKRGNMGETFTCENNATVIANYDARGENARINITAPSLGLNNADVEMVRAMSASGMRFVNETNPASHYSWHAKNNEAMLEVTMANGTVYSFGCDSARPTR